MTFSALKLFIFNKFISPRNPISFTELICPYYLQCQQYLYQQQALLVIILTLPFQWLIDISKNFGQMNRLLQQLTRNLYILIIKQQQLTNLQTT